MNIKKVILLILAGLLVAGCGGISFSPEAAASNAVLGNQDPNFAIDPNTVQIQQTMKLNDESAVVMLTFEGNRDGSGRESCTYAYVVKKQSMGWQPASGGGGCSSPAQNSALLEPLEIGAGQSGSSNPSDPGMSQVYGRINDPSIQKVRVTWMDGQTTEATIINSTYMAVRTGQVGMQSVEGLDAEGQPVYEFAPEVAPGKQ